MRNSDVQFVLTRVDAAVAPIHQSFDAVLQSLRLIVDKLDGVDRTLNTLVDSVADLRTDLTRHIDEEHG
jgi:hypothetical protein